MSNLGNNRLNLLAGIASTSVALILVALKFWAMGETGALSVAASLADNVLDLLASLAGLIAIAYAARPPDSDHPFGHSSAEDLAALGQSVLIGVSGVAIGWSAVSRFLSGQNDVLQAEGRGVAVMVISIALTGVLILFQRWVAGRTGSKVVLADSMHYLSDLMPNLGAIVALLASSLYGLGQIDNIVALAASVVLLVGSLRIGKGAWDALMDREADPALVSAIHEIARDWPGVQGFHDVKTRTAGSRVFVQIHIELDGEQTLRQAHEIGKSLRRRIMNTYPQTDVIIHKDVFGAD